MKTIVRLFLLLFALTIIYFGSTKMGLKIPQIKLPSTTESLTLPEWTEEKVLMNINNYRQENKLSLLTPNDKLKKAAQSRLAVILEYEDSLGDITGLTREKALETVGYEYSWVGDLMVVDFFRSNDLVSYWKSVKVAKQTLDEDNLKEIGVAIKQSGEMVSVYVILSAPKKTPVTQKKPVLQASWGGPELWAAVNKRRVELGVNPLTQKDELCTIAAIRLNQLLENGGLDAHAGFEPTLNREDLKWISQKYNISEFLVSGYATPQEAVSAWENTLGHRKLLSGGEYVWGCVYAQNQIGVAIAAY